MEYEASPQRAAQPTDEGQLQSFLFRFAMEPGGTDDRPSRLRSYVVDLRSGKASNFSDLPSMLAWLNATLTESLGDAPAVRRFFLNPRTSSPRMYTTATNGGGHGETHDRQHDGGSHRSIPSFRHQDTKS